MGSWKLGSTDWLIRLFCLLGTQAPELIIIMAPVTLFQLLGAWLCPHFPSLLPSFFPASNIMKLWSTPQHRSQTLTLVFQCILSCLPAPIYWWINPSIYQSTHRSILQMAYQFCHTYSYFSTVCSDFSLIEKVASCRVYCFVFGIAVLSFFLYVACGYTSLVLIAACYSIKWTHWDGLIHPFILWSLGTGEV